MTTPTAAVPVLQPAQQAPRATPRPHYGKIHAKPLPLTTHPLPPLIPHNPLSLLQIAFMYMYHVLVSPSSHPQGAYQAYWSSGARAVHVTDEGAIRVLWECGFFGKGSLSRSEPSWLDREMRRRGFLANETSEEFTIQRREERKRFKKERARKEREAIEEKLKEEMRSRASSTAEPTARAKYEGINAKSVDSLADSIESLNLQKPEEPPTPTANALSVSTAVENPTTDGIASQAPRQATLRAKEDDTATIVNQEHLQLIPSEAFFLVYGLGILKVLDQEFSGILSTSELFTIFRCHSYFPPIPTSQLQPDDPFILSYTVYHHFRSLGWVVRPGIKFAVDWLLYLRGPVFSHAEFAIIILPAYTNRFWRSTPELEKATRKKESKNWWWLHCVNRVQSQVRKSLVLVYVEVPPPSAIPAADTGKEVDIGLFLKQYKVRELTLKRWIPNRERD